MNRNWMVRHWKWGVVVWVCMLIFVGACAIAARPHDPIFVSAVTGCWESSGSSTGLDCSIWSQHYTYSEFAPPDENMVYDLYTGDLLYLGKGELVVNGFQTALDMFVTFEENKDDSTNVIFGSNNWNQNYNVSRPFNPGDVLFSITPTPKGYAVTWDKLQPMLTATKPGEAILTRNN